MKPDPVTINPVAQSKSSTESQQNPIAPSSNKKRKLIFTVLALAFFWLMVVIALIVWVVTITPATNDSSVLNKGNVLSPAPTPKLKSSLIIFMDTLGKIEIYFKNYSGAVEQQDGSYVLDNINSKLYFTYYSLKDNLSPKLNTYKDSDGNNAGEGCFLSEDKITLANIEFQKQYCYYNPINLTKSGDYDASISSINQTNCIAFLKRENGSISALKISGKESSGSDYCQDFGQLVDLKIELSDPFVVSKESLIGIWHECPFMPDTWCGHYNFYASGKYSYYPEVGCESREEKENGFWSYQNNILKLEQKMTTTLEGGTLYFSPDCSSGKRLIDTTPKDTLLTTPKKFELSVKVINEPYKQNSSTSDGKTYEVTFDPKDYFYYAEILLGKRYYWKFGVNPADYGGEEFPEPTGF